ncbi:MAG: hypothetical protein H0V43_05325 [Gemmatimonadales bacterium]|nr:hypothetical protein [Gemmatimonadales bacterium]MBA3553679.1 hypothetical protein [Gemmatimonadales bacterium]
MSLRKHALVIDVAPAAQVGPLNQLGSPPGTHPHVRNNFRVERSERV